VIILEIVILEKLRKGDLPRGLRYLNDLLKDLSSGLHVTHRIIGLTERGLIKLEISGDDEEAFREIIRRRSGIAPVDFSNLELSHVLRGFIVDSGKVGYGLYIDIGILTPKPIDGLYPLHSIRAQLIEGQQLPIREIINKYSFYDDFPLEVRIAKLEGKVEVELSDRQRESIAEWNDLPFDRVIIYHALPNDLQSAIKSSGIERDLARVENLSLTTHLLTCKIGTQAPGIVAKLGPHLKGSRLFSFSPEIWVRPDA